MSEFNRCVNRTKLKDGSVTAIVQHLIEMTDASEVKYIVDLLTE